MNRMLIVIPLILLLSTVAAAESVNFVFGPLESDKAGLIIAEGIPSEVYLYKITAIEWRNPNAVLIK